MARRAPSMRWLALSLAGLLAGCAMSTVPPTPCPPVVEYDRAFLARAAKELDLLPPESAIVEMLKDYHVMREQARACRAVGR